MLIQKIAANYAKALFSVSGSQDEVKKRQADLEHIVAIIRDQPYIRQLLYYPELPIENRLKMLEKLLQLNLDSTLRRFLAILIKRGKAKYLATVASEYRNLVVNELNILDVDLQSAEPLSEVNRLEVILKLEKKLKKQINLIETVNPTLINGFVLLIGNKLLDLSIKGQLKKFKKLILKGKE